MSARATPLPRPVELGVDWLLRLGLGALFIVAAVGKLRDPATFAIDIANYRFLTSLAPYLAVSLPGVELLLGVALIASPRRWRQAAALGMMLLLLMFTVAVSQVVARGINIECGCFSGEASGPVTALTIVRDLALFLAALAEFWIARALPPSAVSAP